MKLLNICYHRQFLEVLTNGTSLATGYLTSRTFLLTREAVACCLVIVCFCKCINQLPSSITYMHVYDCADRFCLSLFSFLWYFFVVLFLNQVPHISNHYLSFLPSDIILTPSFLMKGQICLYY